MISIEPDRSVRLRVYLRCRYGVRMMAACTIERNGTQSKNLLEDAKANVSLSLKRKVGSCDILVCDGVVGDEASDLLLQAARVVFQPKHTVVASSHGGSVGKDFELEVRKRREEGGGEERTYSRSSRCNLMSGMLRREG